MSKADGWTKKSGWDWTKSGDTFRAEICKVTGNYGWPYMWAVYPLPRSEHLNDKGRYFPIAKGSEGKLAEAKAKADAVIAEWLT